MGWLLHPQTGRERPPGTGPGTPSRPRPGVAHALSAGPASQFPAAKNAAGSRAATLALPRVSASTRGNKGPLRTLWQRPFCSALIVASAHREGGRDSPRVSSCVSSAAPRLYAVSTRGKRQTVGQNMALQASGPPRDVVGEDGRQRGVEHRLTPFPPSPVQSLEPRCTEGARRPIDDSAPAFVSDVHTQPANKQLPS